MTQRMTMLVLVQRAHAAEAQQATAARQRALLEREIAAHMLQRAWRRYSDRRTFAFYQQLIALKQQCEAREVLRYINPREADLIDAAAGEALVAEASFGACMPSRIHVFMDATWLILCANQQIPARQGTWI